MTLTDNLVRAMPPSQRAVSTDAEGRTLTGHFSVFDQWYEIDSFYEGRFLERVAPGAFADTLADPSGIKVLYDHGMDPQIGNKPLGPIRSVGEDDVGAFYEVTLSDTSYNNDLRALLSDGLLGSSFRFAVREDDWHTPQRASDHNPHKLKERTLTQVDVYEFGPVTFPANDAATAAVRSLTDTFADRLASDPVFIARFTERVGANTYAKILEDMTAADGPDTLETPTLATAGSRSGRQRRALVRLHPLT